MKELHMNIVNWSSIQVPRIHNKEKTVSPTDSVGKTGYPDAKEWTWTLTFTINKNRPN
jgi:hypothetical protein